MINERVIISRVIAAPRERVFRNWTQPQFMKQWWGPGGFSCPKAEMDLRPGGTYRLVMQPPEGDPIVVTGRYREITPPSLLVYTWRWEMGPPASDDESVVTVEFIEHDDKTEVIVTHDRFPDGHDRSPYETGWVEGLAKLDVFSVEGGHDA